jgi:hypothetical protein
MKCGVSTSGRNGVSEEMKSVDGCLGVRLPA